MSHRLVTEVFDHAPRDLTTLERLVLLAIADAAQDTHRPGIPARVAFPSMPVLTHRTGKSETAIRAALRRLEARGLNVREPYGTDHTGRPVYAYPGRTTRYRLPQLAKREQPTPGRSPVGVTALSPSEKERRQPGDAITEEWRHGDDEMASLPKRDGVTPMTPNQKKPEVTSPLPPATPSPAAAPTSSAGGGRDDPRWTDAVRAARATVEDDLIDDVVALALADPATRSAGRLAVPAYTDPLAARVRAERASAARTRMTELTRHDAPACQHGAPGGASPHPRTGMPLCAVCRSEGRQGAARGVA